MAERDLSNVSNISRSSEAVERSRDTEDMADGEGFHAADRRSLTTLEVELKHMAMSMSDLVVRMGKLEDSRVSQRDLEQIYEDVDEMRAKKAEKGELHGAAIDDHEKRLRSFEQRTWIWLGGGLAVIAIVELLIGVVFKR